MEAVNDMVNGRVSGGYVKGPGLDIQWQNGALFENGQTGALVEEVIQAALQRLQAYESSGLSCGENVLAIQSLEDALGWLHARRQERARRGVADTYLK